MPLRLKLLLLALSTLVLPLTGWILVRQLETLLREGQAQVQLASAQMLARAVAQHPEALPPAGPAVFVQRASAPLQLDGYDDDWHSQHLRSQELAPGLRLALARFETHVYLFASIDDASRIRADAGTATSLLADQLRLWLEDRDGVHELRLASAAPGPLGIQSLRPAPAPRLHGEWQEDARGYHVELRFPAAYLPQRLGLDALDFSDPARSPQRIGTGAALAEGRWTVQQPPAALQTLLTQLLPQGVSATLTQADGWVLAQTGPAPPISPQSASQSGAHPALPLWRRLLHALLAPDMPPAPPPGTPLHLDLPVLWQALSGRDALAWQRLDHGAGLRLSSAVPIHIDGQVRGALLLERPAEALLLSGQALTWLSLASLGAMLVVGLGLFAFAGRLSARIRTLSRAAERAIARQGRDAGADFVPSASRDELGALSRSFGRLLAEVEAYSDYLRGLAGTLSHELHTPIAVVRSSLENLESEPLPDTARTYVERARSGVERLAAIVRAMSEASRVERAIAAAEAETFDLRALLADCAEGYRALLAPRRLQTLLPPGPLHFHGAPDLIVQALDKLIDNARSFCPPEGWVLIGLAQHPDGAEIVVANAGPLLPAAMQERLFDSLVSLRDKGQHADGAPHLGFGLHVVRLIAQRHHGQARAANLPNGDGVEFRLRLKGMGPPIKRQ